MHSRLSGICRAALLPLLFLCLASGAARAAIIDRIAVIVNEDIVTASEIQAVQQLDLHVSGLPDEDPVLERVDHHLVLQEMAKQPPIQANAEKQQQIIDQYTAQHGGSEKFLMYLSSIGMNYQDFEDELKEQLTIQAFLSLRFRPFVNVTLDQAEQYYNDVYKPELEKKGETAPTFPFTFDEIQNRMIEAQIKEHARQWLEELRKNSSISVKE